MNAAVEALGPGVWMLIPPPTPKDVPILIPGTCEYVMLDYAMVNFVGQFYWATVSRQAVSKFNLDVSMRLFLDEINISTGRL